MTDMQICTITSASARIGLSASQDGVAFVAMSNAPIDRQFLQVRVDDHEAISLPYDARSSANFRDGARVALRQIFSGDRLRTSYFDYSGQKQGVAAICTLPEIIRECGAPIDRIMDTRSQAEIIKGLSR
ncbi:hypothetical protein ARC78_15580 [Stenotrophomonas pictorum JCM 9942]|uniref:Uncharacterized protein n=1 Tax=Stenotrophomonas pictorum JCM 9942 TaxID=1236960 RepID=A0A0R0A157_9GAMM|nr:hypothetical protein ARC78_15580 [Stenotrophomonas pictorum JCM 9942]